MALAPYRTQKWPLEVMREAVRIRSAGNSVRGTAAKLAETMQPAPPVATVAKWLDFTTIRAARLQEEFPMAKLVWRETGHLSDPDAGYALCGAPVRFHGEVEAITEAEACRACLLRAEGASREFVAPARGSDRLVLQKQMQLEDGP